MDSSGRFLAACREFAVRLKRLLVNESVSIGLRQPIGEKSSIRFWPQVVLLGSDNGEPDGSRVTTWRCWAATTAYAIRVTARLCSVAAASYLVDPASSHMLVSKIKPCMSKYKL